MSLYTYMTLRLLPFTDTAPSGQAANGCDTCLHLFTRGTVGRMNQDKRGLETAQCDCFLDPQDDVIAGAPPVIAKIVVETDFGNTAGGQ